MLASGSQSPVTGGNKRTAYLCLIEFIERNGYRWLRPVDEAVEDETVETIVQLAAGQLSELEFTEWVRQHLVDPGT